VQPSGAAAQRNPGDSKELTRAPAGAAEGALDWEIALQFRRPSRVGVGCYW